jgi:hypothetical protein
MATRIGLSGDWSGLLVCGVEAMTGIPLVYFTVFIHQGACAAIYFTTLLYEDSTPNQWDLEDGCRPGLPP